MGMTNPLAILGTHAEWYLHALDGPLAALRYLVKFVPIVRIPILLGVQANRDAVRNTATAS